LARPPEASAAESPPKAVASPDRQQRRGSPLWGLLGASLVLVGVGAVILSQSADLAPTTRVLGGDAPVNAGARSPGDISAHNSPTLARNPVSSANLAVSSRIDTPFFSCALHVSSDAGASWSQTPIPAPKDEESKCFGPDVAFSADGTLYLSFVTLRGRGNVPNAVWLATSKDGGRTLSKPTRVRAPGKLAFQVRLATDPVEPRRLYLTWLHGSAVARLRFVFPGRNPIEVARSDDGGASWTRPVSVNNRARKRVVAPTPVVGPKGELYVLYLDLGEDSLDYEAGHKGRGGPPFRGAFKLVLARSTDRGSTWEESVVERRLVPIQRFIVFFPAAPSLAVDRSGRLYAAFHDGRLGDADVRVWSLEPGSSNWEGPKRVNDTRERDGTWQYLPKVAVAPDGRLDVLYYDRRSDRRNVLNQVSMQSSFDEGETFTPALRLSVDILRDGRAVPRSFSSKIGFGAKEGLPDLGSRLGLVSDDRHAVGLWTDTRAGTPGTQKQDLAQAVAGFEHPTRFSKPVEYGLRFGGLGLGLAGLGLLALWFAGRLPRR
jgi:BNR repeat-like domain